MLLQSTKGRNWTTEEKEKAMKFKKMCTHKCYNFVRKNLVPLPCTWELNESLDRSPIKGEDPTAKAEKILQAVTRPEEDTLETFIVSDMKPEMIQVQNLHDENQVQTVHHIVVQPEVWSQGQEKIEFLVADSNGTLIAQPEQPQQIVISNESSHIQESIHIQDDQNRVTLSSLDPKRDKI